MLWIVLASCVGCAVVLWPLLPWVVIAVWTAGLMRRVHVPLTHRLGERPKIAALVTVALLVLLVVPVVTLVTLLVADAIGLIQRLMASARVRETLQQLVTGDHGQSAPPDLVGTMMSQAERVWVIAREVAGTATNRVIGLVILIVGTYTFLVDGGRWYRWIETNAPVSTQTLRRFTNAFNETGHGLFVGIVGAGLAQSIVATILYIVLGVPQPFALGFLTLGASVIPAVGTAIVWVPVAAGLALTGRPGAAVVLAIAGVAVIGTIDNFVRPYLARRGHLQLPTYVVLLAMFGGIQVMGGWGLLLAPLVVRLAKEALSIARERRPGSHGRTSTNERARVRSPLRPARSRGRAMVCRRSRASSYHSNPTDG
jgi:predicted PurR-regulated permease PerM